MLIILSAMPGDTSGEGLLTGGVFGGLGGCSTISPFAGFGLSGGALSVTVGGVCSGIMKRMNKRKTVINPPMIHALRGASNPRNQAIILRLTGAPSCVDLVGAAAPHHLQKAPSICFPHFGQRIIMAAHRMREQGLGRHYRAQMNALQTKIPAKITPDPSTHFSAGWRRRSLFTVCDFPTGRLRLSP